MSHPESVTAVLTANEPADGTVLILHEGGDDWRTIVRLDEVTANNGQKEHWYDGADQDEDPRALYDWVKDATTVYALGEKLAAF